MTADGPRKAGVVLVVEDDKDVRRTLERSLRRLGYEVVEAENADKGLALALELRPQVILSDIRMPGMDGHTLLRRLTAHDSDAAVIVMSAHGTMEDVIDVLRNGAVDYLRKPWNPTELSSAVARAILVNDGRRSGNASRPEVGASAARVLAGVHDYVPKAQLPATTPSLLDRMHEKLERNQLAMPPIAPILIELRSILASADATLQQIASIVQREPRLVSHVMRIVNSAQYARGARINDVRTAVSRIGMGHVQSLVLTLIYRDAPISRDPVLRRMQSQIWRYSFARALSMRGLADMVADAFEVEPDLAYLAGLMADTGASLLLWAVTEAGHVLGAEADAYIDGVREKHHLLGASLLGRGTFDPVVRLIAQNHHLQSPPAPPSPYWSLAILGSAMADSLGVGGDPTRTTRLDPELIDRCGSELGIGSRVATQVSESVRQEFDSAMTMLG